MLAGSQQLRAQDPMPVHRFDTEGRTGSQGRRGGDGDENRDGDGDGEESRDRGGSRNGDGDRDGDGDVEEDGREKEPGNLRSDSRDGTKGARGGECQRVTSSHVRKTDAPVRPSQYADDQRSSTRSEKRDRGGLSHSAYCPCN